jgi:hypothetical protein
MSDAIRQIRARARRKAAGLVRLEFWVPLEKRDQVRAMVAELLTTGGQPEPVPMPAPVPTEIQIDPPPAAAPIPPGAPVVAGRRRRLITDIDGLLD